MAEGKRYYWLRLKDDFFQSKRIKKLRRMAGGDTYVIIYLKMQLKSIKSNGVLEYTGLEGDFAEELALDLDEQVDDVRMTLNYLQAVNLIESSDNINFFLPYAVENTGSEGASAKRMRDMRERHNVTPMLRSSDGEKEIEIEIKKEKESESYIEEESAGETPDPPFDDGRSHINWEGLILGALRRGDTEAANRWYQCSRQYGVEIDVDSIKRSIANEPKG